LPGEFLGRVLLVCSAEVVNFFLSIGTLGVRVDGERIIIFWLMLCAFYDKSAARTAHGSGGTAQQQSTRLTPAGAAPRACRRTVRTHPALV